MLIKSTKMIISHLLILLAFVSFSLTSVNAQTDEEVKEAMTKGLKLLDEGKFVEAIPYLDTLVKVSPDEPQLRFIYGVALITKSKQISASEEAKQLSAKALEQFKKAKELGLNEKQNDAFIALLSGNVSSLSANPIYSKNPEAEKLMNQAEKHFSLSEYDEAFRFYQKALALDPNIYEAALYSGDIFTQKQDWEKAELWYQKAIKINPNRETAYRYSATPLMKQKKYDQARDRYIEAFITEPYNRTSSKGISQWADITGATLAHPKINFPEITFDSNGKANSTLSINPNDASTLSWAAYVTTREAWKKEKFGKIFPNEKIYRHTLQEEVEAVRSVINLAKQQKSNNAQFKTLEKLDSEGLLEAYILMAKADEGIADDFGEYLKNNRAKLRQYVLNYVIQK